ncbi:hypothetical protein FQZ97_229270 [compost metagenome]
MADLSADLQTSITTLQGKHSALVSAVRGYSGGSVAAKANERLAAKTANDKTVTARVNALRASIAAANDGSLSLDFVNGMYLMGATSLDRGYALGDLISFTRGSTATGWGSDGKLRSFAANEPRIEYDPLTGAVKGLLVEGQRTNLLPNSDNFLAWGNSGTAISPLLVVPMAADGPRGPATMTKLLRLSNGIRYLNRVISASAGSTLTYTCYAKVGESGNSLALRMQALWPAIADASFDLAAGTVLSASDSGDISGVSASIEPVGGGVYRCRLTATAGASAWTSVYAAPGSEQIDSVGNAGIDCYIDTAQVELGAFPSSYIPTPTTFTSRPTPATYIGSDGLTKTAAANVARDQAYMWDSGGVLRKIGLLLEGAGANLLASTSRFTLGWASSNGALTIPNVGVAPDGTLTASALEFPNDYGYLRSTPLQAVAAGQALCASVFVKRNSGKIGIRITNTGSTRIIRGAIDSAARTITAGPTSNSTLIGVGMIPAGPEWDLYYVSGSFSSEETQACVMLLRDGNSTQLGATVRGAQFETGTYPTSHIPSIDSFTSRASSAWFFDNTGTLQSAANNVARSNAYGYDSAGNLKPIGLLLEPQATNKVLNSGNPMSGSWTPVSIQSRQASGDVWNGMTGTRVIGSGGNWNRLTGLTTAVVSASEVVTLFYKPGTSGRVRLVHRDNSANDGSGLESNIVGPVGGPYTLTTFAGDLRLIRDIPSGTSGVRMMQTVFTPNTLGNSFSFAAGPDSVVAGEDIVLYGMQVESGTAPTSYIPTGAAQVTRAADVSSSVAGTRAADVSSSPQVTRPGDVITVESLSPWFNPSEGTLFVDAYSPPGPGGSVAPRLVEIRQSNSDYIGLVGSVDGANLSANCVVGGISQVSGFAKTTTVGSRAKVSFAYKQDDFAVSFNGAAPATDTSGSLPAPTKLQLGARGDNTAYAYTHIRAFRYYPRRLTNPELQALTS